MVLKFIDKLLGRNSITTGNAKEIMKRDWEKRARENALHYIADFREKWDDDLQGFFESGRHDVEKFLADTDWQPEECREGVLVEIGCGAGRMTRHFAEMFSSIIALDISEKMIELARQYNPDLPHVEFRAGNGVDLHPLPDSSADFVISYIVFQHIPLPEVIHGYISEGLRVLKPGGRFRFQARNDHQHMKTDTYAGASMDLDIVEQLARDHGCNVHQITGRGEHYCFVELRRPKASQSV